MEVDRRRGGNRARLGDADVILGARDKVKLPRGNLHSISTGRWIRGGHLEGLAGTGIVGRHRRREGETRAFLGHDARDGVPRGAVQLHIELRGGARYYGHAIDRRRLIPERAEFEGGQLSFNIGLLSTLFNQANTIAILGYGAMLTLQGKLITGELVAFNASG